ARNVARFSKLSTDVDLCGICRIHGTMRRSAARGAGGGGGETKRKTSKRIERERQAEDEACLRATRAHGGGTGSPLWPAVSRRLAAGGTHHGWSASGARRQLPTTCTRDRPRGARAPRKLAC
ncbi:unnamed protein product, partial [Prorocentrum cordatum]